MKLDRRTFAFLIAGVLSLCATDAFCGIRPLPPGARPPAGWAWCPRCEGRRYVPSGFLGWTSKPCPKCDAYGMVRLPPPPPPPIVKQPHRKPAPTVCRQSQPVHRPVQQQPVRRPAQQPVQSQPPPAQRYQKTPPRR